MTRDPDNQFIIFWCPTCAKHIWLLRAVAHNASVRCTDCRTEMTQELPEVLRKDAAKS